MKIKIWIAVTDQGDGSHGVRLYPSEERLREDLELDDEDFSPGYDVPVEISYKILEFAMVEN